MNVSITRARSGLVLIGNAAMLRLSVEANLAEWKRKKATGPGRDPRLLGDERIGASLT